MFIPDKLLRSVKLAKKSEKTDNAGLFGVFDTDDKLTFELTVPRAIGLFRPSLVFYRDSDSAEISFEFELSDFDMICDSFSCAVPMADLCPEGERDALLWYTVVADSGYGRLRISCSRSSYRPTVNRIDSGYDGFQLTVRPPAAVHPDDKFAGGIIYHVFVDRFAKGSRSVPVREGAIIDPDWENGIPEYAEVRGGFVRNNRFFGGTLWGVIERLDYIAELGVNMIYLSPVFEAYSNHKYDTGDYMKVDAMFGGDEALSLLVEKAGEKGISVILDGVFNHTGADSRYFNKFGRYNSIGAYQSKESPYYKWYEFDEFPDSYRCWWGIDILPAVTTTDSSYTDFICGKDGVLAKYMKMGVSGWRLDVADELSEEFLETLCDRVKTENSTSIVFGEVWEDASDKIAYGRRRKYFRGGQLDSVMNYPLRAGVIRFVKYGDKAALFEATALLYSHYPKETSDLLMNHLGTHDTERILTVLGGEPDGDRPASELALARLTDEQRSRAVEMLKLCWLIVAALPGLPCIYYGDEAGMEGYRDPFNRMPFVPERADKELTGFYRSVGKMRRSEPLFAGGYFEVDENTPDGVFAFRRFSDSDIGYEIYVVANASDRSYITDVGGEDLLTGERHRYFDVLPKKAVIIRKKL